MKKQKSTKSSKDIAAPLDLIAAVEPAIQPQVIEPQPLIAKKAKPRAPKKKKVEKPQEE